MSGLPFHPLADLFPLLEGAEFDELVSDIRVHGLREPVVVLDGMILDGRNRYRACRAAEVAYDTRSFDGTDPVAFVISANLRRRHLSESQRAMVAAKLANLSHGGDRRSDQAANLPLETQVLFVSQTDAARFLNVSERSVRAAKGVRDSAVPELAHMVETDTISVSAAAEVARLPEAEQREVVARGEREIVRIARQIQRDKKDQRKVERVAQIASLAADVPAVAERYELHHTSFTDIRDWQRAGSIDIIVTDPPYPAEFLDLFGELGAVADHVLKPGGLAVVMVGQSYLPEIIAHLGKHLTYHWTLAYLTPGGQAVQQFQRRVNAFWKPVLVYAKGEYSGAWFADVAKSDPNDNDKEHHHWGQSASGMRDLMRRFVQPGHVVLDPFLGGGTTAVVALELGAHFIGFDIDESAITATKARIGGGNAAVAA